MDLQTRNQYMKAMGIPVWMPRISEDDVAADADVPQNRQQLSKTHASVARNTTQDDVQYLGQQVPNKVPAPASITALVNDTPDHQQITPISPPASRNPATASRPVTAPDCSGMDWANLQESVRNCQLCGLHQSRTQTVFGTGDRQANWMIVGEAPGANEDRQGEPFVGKAGKLLNNMLAAVGLPRNAVYISNVLKCRPPNNRDPKPEESALCRGYLERQIALVQPTLIIVVGRIAAHNLLHVTTPLGRLRGTVHSLPGTELPVIVTYHPAYLLRQPTEKRKAWQDLQLARQVMINSN